MDVGGKPIMTEKQFADELVESKIYNLVIHSTKTDVWGSLPAHTVITMRVAHIGT